MVGCQMNKTQGQELVQKLHQMKHNIDCATQELAQVRQQKIEIATQYNTLLKLFVAGDLLSERQADLLFALAQQQNEIAVKERAIETHCAEAEQSLQDMMELLATTQDVTKTLA